MQCANFLGLQLKVNWGSKGTKGPAHLFLSASLGGLGSGLVTSREHLLPTQTSCYVIICWNKRDTLTPGARAHDGGVGRGTAARVPSQPERDSLTAASVPSQPERDSLTRSLTANAPACGQAPLALLMPHRVAEMTCTKTSATSGRGSPPS